MLLLKIRMYNYALLCGNVLLKWQMQSDKKAFYDKE